MANQTAGRCSYLVFPVIIFFPLYVGFLFNSILILVQSIQEEGHQFLGVLLLVP